MFFKTLHKLLKRKKVNGYYNSDYMISHKEKESLLIGFSIITIPLIIGLILFSLN